MSKTSQCEVGRVGDPHLVGILFKIVSYFLKNLRFKQIFSKGLCLLNSGLLIYPLIFCLQLRLHWIFWFDSEQFLTLGVSEYADALVYI